MTAFPETRYVCDRCHIEVAVAMTNVAVNQRAAGAAGWLMLAVGSDPSHPPKHLCDKCADKFVGFMSEIP